MRYANETMIVLDSAITEEEVRALLAEPNGGVIVAYPSFASFVRFAGTCEDHPGRDGKDGAD